MDHAILQNTKEKCLPESESEVYIQSGTPIGSATTKKEKNTTMAPNPCLPMPARTRRDGPFIEKKKHKNIFPSIFSKLFYHTLRPVKYISAYSVTQQKFKGILILLFLKQIHALLTRFMSNKAVKQTIGIKLDTIDTIPLQKKH